ncbi:g2699 [Coccomyxa elongata]
MARDLTVFNVRVFPQTIARAAIMVQSSDNITAFLQHLVMHPDEAYDNQNTDKFMSSERLWQLYRIFIGDGGVFGRQTNRCAFAKRMKSLLRGYEHHTNSERGFVVPKPVTLERLMRSRRQWSDDQF